jgi:N-acetyl-alpha-D-muramate 1-phosphate uridylyltransferase
MSLQVVILAGGLATRLRPITEHIPKSLVTVNGVPFISRQLEYLKSQKIEKVTICIGHLGNMVKTLVGDGSKFGLQVTYSEDGPNLKGTGGAIKNAMPLLDDVFFVLYGDSYLPIDFSNVEKAFFNNNKSALMTIIRNTDKWDKSNVLFSNEQLIEYNKEFPLPSMDYIDYGLGILSKDLFAQYKDDRPFDLSEVYRNLSLSGGLHGYLVHERFYEVGSHQGLRDIENYFVNKDK